MKTLSHSLLLGSLALAAACSSLSAKDLLFNFGPDDSIVIENWTNVSTTPYSAERGWGWETPPDVVRKRDKAPNPVEDTLVGVSPNGREAVFRIDLEPGLYEVVTSRGDAAFPANTTVFLNNDRGPWAERGLRPAGDFVRASRTVWVRDGILRLRIPPRETRGEPFNMLNWLRVYPVEAARVPTMGNNYGIATQPLVPGFMPEDLIRRIEPLPVPLDQVNRVAIAKGETLVLNFGPVLNDLPESILQPSTQAFSAERGYGWLGAVPNITRQRNRHEDPLLDTMVGVDTSVLTRQFVIALEPGSYQVEVAMNDPQFPFNACMFVGPGDAFHINRSGVPANQAIIQRETIELEEGLLYLRVVGASPFSMLSYLKITKE